MARTTTIEWTRAADGSPGATWNPVTGCDRVSPGCDHCYALALADRLKAMGNPRYQRDGDPRRSGPGFGLTLHWDLVDLPRGWRRPSLVFVNSINDLFHDRVPVAFIEAVFRTIAETPQHTYQVLTKRSARLLRLSPHLPWPANVWMGVSVEKQDYDIRAWRLVKVPAAVRFLSVEPMLGPVNLRQWSDTGYFTGHLLERIQWVIVGGESGPGARPLELRWVRSLVAQCRAAGVACFVKQLGSAWAGRGRGGDPSAWPEDLRVRQMPWTARAGR